MSADLYHQQIVEGGAGAPLFFLFHGTGGDENQFVDVAARLAPQATLVSPRGDVSEFGAARFFRRTGEGVYDMADLARATAKMQAYVEAHVAARRPAAVLGLGYSNGANILANLQFKEPSLFDRTVLMHPLIPFEPIATGEFEGRAVLVTAGRRDPICPLPMTERLAAALRAAGADVTLAWHDGGHEIRPSEFEAAHRFLAG